MDKFSIAEGLAIEGYEIHTGATRPVDGQPTATCLLVLDGDSGADGMMRSDGSVAGTYVHGVFERPEPRAAEA